MTPEVKAILRERAKKKRGVLLKDCTPDDFLVACDYVESELGVTLLPPLKWLEREGTKWVPSYLKYAKPEQIAALESRIPFVRCRLAIPGPGRKPFRIVTLFDTRFLSSVLRFLVGVDKCSSYFKVYPHRIEHNLITEQTIRGEHQ